MRVLVTSTSGAGHFGPLVPVVEAAARRADDVLFVVPSALAERVEATGHAFRIGADPPAEEMAAILERVPTASRREAAILVNREVFGRLDTAAMLPAVEAACEDWQPDLVLREAAEYAAAIAAERRGLPHAQIAIGLAQIESWSLDLAAPVLTDYGETTVQRIRASPYLSRIPASLDPSPFTATYRFRESAGTPPSPLPDWWDGEESPLVYVSFGSITGRLPAGAAAYRAAVRAVRGLGVRVLVSTGRTLDPAALGPLPPNVHAEAWVSQDDVLGQASVVVCHGGAGTTFGALRAGLPVVFVPFMADQPANARLVAEAGAGLVVQHDFGAADPVEQQGSPGESQIRAAIQTMLVDDSYREAAQRIAAQTRTVPAIDEVLDALAAGIGPGISPPRRDRPASDARS